MKGEQIKAWLTKHALTSGIEVVDAEVLEDGQRISYTKPRCFLEFAHGKEWHRTPAAALARAEEMRKAKIALLRRRIAVVESMTFEAPEAS